MDRSWKGLYRAGGIAMLADGLILLLATALSPSLAPLLSGSSEAALKYLPGQLPAQVFLWLVVPLDLLFIPAILALCLALKGIDKNAMVVAAAFLGLGIVFDLGVTGSQGLYLMTLSQNYAAATSDAERAAYVAAADYARTVLVVGLSLYSSLVLAIGFLIASLVMLKGIFRRAVAYSGIAISLLGIVAGLGILVPSLTVLELLFPTLLAIWILPVGFRLYRLGRR